MSNNTLPAGLFSKDTVEFFANTSLRSFCLSGGMVIPANQFGSDILNIIEDDIKKHPVKEAALNELGIKDKLERIAKYIVCNYGGFDNQPDIVDGQLMPTEYWPCPLRGKCKHEGKLCDSLRTDSGEYLTKREIEVLKLIAIGALDKEIAEALNISINTVPTHTRNIRRKTMMMRKSDLTRYAMLKNLI